MLKLSRKYESFAVHGADVPDFCGPQIPQWLIYKCMHGPCFWVKGSKEEISGHRKSAVTQTNRLQELFQHAQGLQFDRAEDVAISSDGPMLLFLHI